MDKMEKKETPKEGGKYGRSKRASRIRKRKFGGNQFSKNTTTKKNTISLPGASSSQQQSEVIDDSIIEEDPVSAPLSINSVALPPVVSASAKKLKLLRYLLLKILHLVILLSTQECY